MKFVYGLMGMTYRLQLSTRPEKYLGEVEVWNFAETQLSEALNEFIGEGTQGIVCVVRLPMLTLFDVCVRVVGNNRQLGHQSW
jgi:hypothetical protein